MTIEDLRFIVFLIDSKFKQHDGKVFKRLSDAREFCRNVIESKDADKIIIGTFTTDGSIESSITCIETYGFKNDKKQIEQLELFN